MLCPLTRASLRVILLPGKPSLLPALVHRVYEVLAETVVQVFGLCSIRTGLKSIILNIG
jgi:hypothetical protein